ncbi:DUF3043 domain-containing protein [Corynebacterium uberis]|uniref:DUF3043 domain-containing protein n=1 Tax=Corynebacterium TaxID=1716 RepID=UPI001D09B7E2|nr:DUF3043 domain-containing protein [Corynebacterium uberis]MCZ9308273.1 DUF3043 domain-containing protein [Corynebacterium sp. c6VSa_13]UDL73952.1 DUF3043 domain-containing protein [Corynebacterium uberis]UDL75165.1 DUF3043 domain-containing protein [Corynebacterium uberis]UDL77376.1 DUF3043 domain-containing protein [Corynebacterium uberis]UDL79661.1 DUF3043 domain-containing protein [Corynebacterium uberis]
MKLPWRSSQNSSDPAAESAGATAVSASGGSTRGGDRTNGNSTAAADKPLPKGYTPPKGRPTPTRREQELERGVIRGAAMAPTTPAQQREKRKELKASMSKQEWKDYKRKERERSRERQRETQAAIDRGDERFLLARDRGAERAFARDWVDARRFALNWVMPFALFLLVVMVLSNVSPAFAGAVSLASLVVIAIFFVEGVTLGIRLNRATRKKFPDSSQTGFGLGFYGFSRATQPRKWRSPRARVNIGDPVN